MLSQVECHAYLEFIAFGKEGHFAWCVVENFTHSEIVSVVIVRAAIVLGTKPGTLHSIHFAGIETFSAWMILIKRKDLRWNINSTANCTVVKTCRLECLTFVSFHNEQPN